jgi:GDP-L-fucose synthase
LGDGTSVREFLHVDDFANAINNIIKKQLYTDSITNVSGANLCTVRELSQIIRKVSGYEGNIIFSNDGQNGAAAKLLDGTRLKESGWEPCISLEQGLARAYFNLLP